MNLSHEFLSYLWYFILALVWAVYVVQDMFVCGVAMLSKTRDVNSKEFKQLNESVGLHWDGIQVWLVLAVGGLFAAFYHAYAVVLSELYIAFFLLLYAIIGRGLSIELIYKSESTKWRRALAIIWPISSFLLMLIVGLYLTNLFVGLPIEDGHITSFWSIFNLIGILGGILFVSTSLVLGFMWINLAVNKQYTEKIGTWSKWFAFASTFTMIVVLFGINNTTTHFTDGYLFTTYPIIWLLPSLAVATSLIGLVAVLLKKSLIAFVSYILSIILYIFTGFSATFPYMLYSTTNENEGMLIVDASASQLTLSILLGATLVFVPIVLGYQTWKYKRFWRDF